MAKTSGRSNEKEICANRSYSSSCLLWILRDVEKRVGRGGGKSWTSSWISIPLSRKAKLLIMYPFSVGRIESNGDAPLIRKGEGNDPSSPPVAARHCSPKETHIPGLGRWLPIKLCRHHQFSSQGRRRRKTKHRIGGGSPNWSQRKRRLRIADVICSSKHPQSILYTRIVSNRSTNLF